MEKSPDAFRTISEVAESLDLPQHVLRFWESRFPQIKPLKRGGGRRYYRPDDVELLRAIKGLLYDEGYTIKGVQKMLREQGAQALAHPQPVAPPPRSEPAPARIEPVLRRAEPAAPPQTVSPPTPPAPAKSASAPSDIAALRAILMDLREAERILAQAQSV